MFESEHMCFQSYGQILNSDLHPVVKKNDAYTPPSKKNKKIKKKKRKKSSNFLTLTNSLPWCPQASCRKSTSLTLKSGSSKAVKFPG